MPEIARSEPYGAGQHLSDNKASIIPIRQKEVDMRLLAVAAALCLAMIPPAFADETSATPGVISASAKVRHAAPVMASDRAAIDARERRETRAMNLIGAAGYSDFTDLKTDGKDFQATAMKGEQRVSIRIDPDSGRVTPQP